MADKIQIQILPGGLVKLETDRVSSPNHLSADRLVRGLEDDLGGDTETRRKTESTLAHKRATDLDLT
jgi:hypothetical protein